MMKQRIAPLSSSPFAHIHHKLHHKCTQIDLVLLSSYPCYNAVVIEGTLACI